MTRRAVVVIAVLVTGLLSGCGGGGGRKSSPPITPHETTGTMLPPIYPGTTVSIPPSTTSSSASSSGASKPPGRTIPGDGTFQVGVDIQAGTYRSDGGDSCYWERLRGLGGKPADIIANGAGYGPQVVTIAASDVAFKTQHCAAWTLQSSTTSTTTSSSTTSSTTPAALPPGAQPCPSSGGATGGLSHSAVGSSGTTCPFAEQVRQAYGASGAPSSAPRQIDAVSPVTGEHYSMTCAANGPMVVCNGGNDAVVYVY